MTTKQTFKFEYAPLPDSRSDPAQHRRARLVERLQEQSKLAIDPTATTRTLNRNKGKGDQRKVVEIKQVIRPQWRVGPNGKVLFWMRGASGKIEFATGQFAIVVPDVKSIPPMVEALIERVQSGEFDAQLTAKREKQPKAKPIGTPVNMKKAGLKRKAA